MKLLRNVSYVLLTLAFAALVGSCKSTPDPEDPDFLGYYEKQDLGKIIGNTLGQYNNDLKAREFMFTFYPNGNAIEMDFHYEMNFIRLTLLQKDREVMVAAMQKYIEDYQNGLLTKKNNKKRAYFGKTPVLLMWGLMAPAMRANVKLRFEYQLIEDNKPYFIVANMTEPEVDEDGDLVADGANSPGLRLAFTPNQCMEIINLIKQEALLERVHELDAKANQFDIVTPETGATEAPPAKKELF